MNPRLLTATLMAIAVLHAAGYEAIGLECELATDPLGVDSAHPRLAWQVKSDQRGQLQTA